MDSLLNWTKKVLKGGKGARDLGLGDLFRTFSQLLSMNNRALELISDASEKLGGNYVFDRQYIEKITSEILDAVEKQVILLDILAPGKYKALFGSFYRLKGEIEAELSGRPARAIKDFILFYQEIDRDMADAVGGKNVALAEIKRQLGMNIPPSCAVTTAAFDAFVKKNNLDELINDTLSRMDKGLISAEEASKKIQSEIEVSPLPVTLQFQLNKAALLLMQEHPSSTLFLAMRSSAPEEDGDNSLAGQFKSLLNVPPFFVEKAYKIVVASLFSKWVLEYRRTLAPIFRRPEMAVVLQKMVDAAASGVLFTMDPSDPCQDHMIIRANWGLGTTVVSGKDKNDRFLVSRSDPGKIVSMDIMQKRFKEIPVAPGGTKRVEVPEELQLKSCLSIEQIGELGSMAMKIERHFKRPQDIEFSVTGQGQIVILQTRPLRLNKVPDARPVGVAELSRKYRVISKGRGVIVQSGIGSGPVYIFRYEHDLDGVPQGAVLVARFPSPILASVLSRCSALLVESGSETCHLAAIAREHRIPAIFGLTGISETLKNGMVVTVDAEEDVIYEGEVRELQFYTISADPIEESKEYRLLRRILKKIEPLNLIDPADPDFRPEACRTLHDIIRFTHEKGVEEIISHLMENRFDASSPLHKLVWKVPLDLVIIDLGGGVEEGADADIDISQITSLGLREMLEALAIPGVWSSEPVPVDVRSFIASITRTFSPEISRPEFIGQNLAVVSRHYTNLALRLGYHFNMIDTYVGDEVSDNYIYFRFFGGVTELPQRRRRATLIGMILSENDFLVEQREDMVIGRLKGMTKDEILQRLHMLGMLVGFTRQLDVFMTGEKSIEEQLENFRRFMEVKNGKRQQSHQHPDSR